MLRLQCFKKSSYCKNMGDVKKSLRMKASISSEGRNFTIHDVVESKSLTGITFEEEIKYEEAKDRKKKNSRPAKTLKEI